MAKIPTVDPEVGLRVANMPNLPRSVVSSMSAPGRAQQGLGRAIGGLAGAFKGDGQGQSEEEQFNDKLEMLKAGNELEFNERKTQAEYNPSENDPGTYHEGRKGHFESWAAGVRQRIKDPRKAELFIERNRGRFYDQTYRFGSQQKVRKSISTVESAINGEISKLDPADRKTFDANFSETMRGVNGMIDAMPGVTSSQKDALRARAAKQGMKMILSKILAGERLPALKKMIERWDAEGAAANEGPGEVAPNGTAQSAPAPGTPPPIRFDMREAKRRIIETQDRGGRVRSKPISGNLRTALASAVGPEKGIQVEIYSGGQARRGSGGPRIGSTRHDAGNAADLKLFRIVDGQKQYLSMNNPEDRKIMEGFVERAVAAGAHGVGAHPEYMGEHGLHIGYGKAAAWGKGKSSRGAPDWLKAAHARGLGGGSSQTASSSGGAASKYAGKIANTLVDAAKKAGIDPDTFVTFAKIESGLRPRVKTGSYKGLLQLSDKQFRKYGGKGDIYDPGANAAAGANKVKDLVRTFQKANGGRAPNATELYMMHQQGVAGQRAHYGNPDGKAWQNIRKYYRSESMAKRAIWGNVPRDVRRKFGSVDNMTSRDFINMWDAKVKRIGGGSVQPASNDPSGSTGPAAPNTPSASSSSVQSFMRKGITAMMPQLLEEHDKAVALLKQRTRVAGMISGQEPFNPFGADKKIVDDTFKAGDLHKRMFAGDQDAIMKGVEISQRLNYVPKPVGDALQGLANHEDPKARVMALEAAGSILARNPNALDNTDLGRLKKDAESYVALTTGTGKRSPKEALERMIEMKSPEWKKKAEARKTESNELVKSISSSHVNQALGNWAERNVPFMNPNISNTDIVTSEYKKSFVEHFTRWGDADMAHKLAANDLKKVYGPTTVRGSTEVMMYPPDRSYPPIGEKGHEYLSDDIVEAVTANLHERAKELLRVAGGDPSKAERPEIDMSDIQLIPDARTAREVAANKPPTYKIMFMVPGDYGVQVPVVMRWGLGQEDIEAARAKWSSKTLKDRPALLDKEAEQSKAQKAQRERFKESDEIDREIDERLRKYREERAAP